MIKLVSVGEMREIEKEANAGGLTYAQMMENAGSGLAGIVQSAYSQIEPKVVVGLIGSGNNGGDTLVALRELAKDGWEAHAALVRERAEADPLVEELKSVGGQVEAFGAGGKNSEGLASLLGRSTVLLDGVLGTGIKLPLKKEIAALLALVKAYVLGHPGRLKVVAVDCPSGVDSDNGEAASECIPAGLTVCMAAIKTGLLEFPAFNSVGTLLVADIGLPEDLPAWEKVKAGVVDRQYARHILPERRADAHKGTFGTALAVIGSVNYTGAALLAGKAAYRVGAGLVTLGVPSPLHAALAGHFPEATWLLLPHELGVISSNAVELVLKNLERITALLLGPGWAQEDTTREFLERLLEVNSMHGHPSLGFVHALDEGEAPKVKLPPLVIDADGLKLLAKIPDWWKRLPQGTILNFPPGGNGDLERPIYPGDPVQAVGDCFGIRQEMGRGAGAERRQHHRGRAGGPCDGHPRGDLGAGAGRHGRRAGRRDPGTAGAGDGRFRCGRVGRVAARAGRPPGCGAVREHGLGVGRRRAGHAAGGYYGFGARTLGLACAALISSRVLSFCFQRSFCWPARAAPERHLLQLQLPVLRPPHLPKHCHLRPPPFPSRLQPLCRPRLLLHLA